MHSKWPDPTDIRFQPRAFLAAKKAISFQDACQIPWPKSSRQGARARPIPLHVACDVQRQGRGKIYTATIWHDVPKPLALDRIELFRLDLQVPEIEVFRLGFNMPGDPAGFYVLTAGRDVPQPYKWNPEGFSARDFRSFTLTAMDRPEQRTCLLAGFTTFNRFNGYFIFNTQGRTIRFSAFCNLEGLVVPPGQPLQLESLMVTDAQFNRCLEFYADYVGRTSQARFPRRTVTGWIDWQYYREEKNERDILRTVKTMRTLKRRGFPLKTVVVDGGWCAYASEWMRPCAKFPNMARFARMLRRQGFELGLWLAPYITNVKTEVARRHPDWMVIDCKTGKPLFKPRSNVGPCCILDFTVPAALEWLRRVVRRMVRDWKIGYLKLDGPNPHHYYGGRFHNSGLTAIEQIRRSLAVIREECGARVIVEGEGIYGPSIGFVDTQRTQQDNQPEWYAPDTGKPVMKENLKNELLNAFTHRRFWHNHRENIILRDFPSPFHHRHLVNPELKDQILPQNELLCQVSAGALAGGAMLLTDPLDELQRNPSRVLLVSQFLPHYESLAARPLDVFQHGKQPALFYLPIRRDFEHWFMVGVFNWEEAYQNYQVPLQFAGPGVWHGFEFWTEQYLGRFSGRMTVRDVPPHGCRLVALRRHLGHPQLVGTNLHLFQGAVDLANVTWNSNRLQIVVNHFYQCERKLFFYVPRGYKLQRVQSNARDYLVDDRQPGRLTIQFNGRRGTTFTLDWRKA